MRDINFYFKREAQNSEFIKPEFKGRVYSHLLGTINLLKTGNKLTVNEKKALGINTRLSITRELIEVLNEKGLRLHYPSAVLTEMWSRAANSKSRHDRMSQLREGSIAEVFTLMSCGDGNDCSWCQANQDVEFPVTTDIEHLIESNCTCNPYCKCSIMAKVDLTFGEPDA